MEFQRLLGRRHGRQILQVLCKLSGRCAESPRIDLDRPRKIRRGRAAISDIAQIQPKIAGASRHLRMIGAELLFAFLQRLPVQRNQRPRIELHRRRKE
jgi:hypothetical protein